MFAKDGNESLASRFCLSHWSTKKKCKFSKKKLKTPFRRVAQKRYNFAPGAANHTFYSPCIYVQDLEEHCQGVHGNIHLSVHPEEGVKLISRS